VKGTVRLRASIDLGTTKVSAMIAEWQGTTATQRRPFFWPVRGRDPDAQVLGAAQLAPPAPLRIIGVGTTQAEGLKQGVIVDIDRVAGAIDSHGGMHRVARGRRDPPGTSKGLPLSAAKLDGHDVVGAERVVEHQVDAHIVRKIHEVIGRGSAVDGHIAEPVT